MLVIGFNQLKTAERRVVFTLTKKPYAHAITYLYVFISILLLNACGDDAASIPVEDTPPLYSISGRVVDNFGNGIAGIEIVNNPSMSVFTGSDGYWRMTELAGQQTVVSSSSNYIFSPDSFEVNKNAQNLVFTGNRIASDIEAQIFNWFDKQQLPNGLLESVEDGNIVSLYDNALAAMVFMLVNDFARAEEIFDFFNARVESELTVGVGGFSQLRARNGAPNNHRWMGDNAWLLIALNNYKARTGLATYDNLASELSTWLVSLQDDDGGLFAGYNANNRLLNYKVTEGNIDAFNAIDGYTGFHAQILDFLERERWSATENSLVAWPENPQYLYALDLHPWAYSIFNNYPVETLISAQRFLTTQTASSGIQVTGYCFDEDKDTIWPEGTGQMALAFGIADMQSEKQLYLNEIEYTLIQSVKYSDAAGFPYASNVGTVYGPDLLWVGADTKIAISGGAWYLFAQYNFNPFDIGRDKDIAESDMFWLN